MKGFTELSAVRSHPADDGQRQQVLAGPDQRHGVRQEQPQPVPVSPDLPTGEPVIEELADGTIEGTPPSAALVPNGHEWCTIDLVGWHR